MNDEDLNLYAKKLVSTSPNVNDLLSNTFTTTDTDTNLITTSGNSSYLDTDGSIHMGSGGMSIGSTSGNIGIGMGTTNPSGRLHVTHGATNYSYGTDSYELTQSQQVTNLLSSIASVELMLISLKNSVMELTSKINPVKHEKRTLKTKQ